MDTLRLTTVVLIAAALAGCNKSPDAAPAAAAQSAATPAPTAAAPPPAEPAAAAPEDDPGGLADLKAKQDAAGGPIHWKQLVPFLPDEIGEFKATSEIEGATQDIGNGVKVTNASRGYKAGKVSLSITITDSFMSPAMMLLGGKIKADRDGSDGFTKTIRIGKYPALLSWEKVNEISSIQLLAGDRVLDLRERWTATPEDAERVAKLIKLDELAALRGDGK